MSRGSWEALLDDAGFWVVAAIMKDGGLIERTEIKSSTLFKNYPKIMQIKNASWHVLQIIYVNNSVFITPSQGCAVASESALYHCMG